MDNATRSKTRMNSILNRRPVLSARNIRDVIRSSGEFKVRFNVPSIIALAERSGREAEERTIFR